MKPHCGICRHVNYVQVGGRLVDGHHVGGTIKLECRRYPPTTDGFAYVKDDEWCGEFATRPRPIRKAPHDATG